MFVPVIDFALQCLLFLARAAARQAASVMRPSVFFHIKLIARGDAYDNLREVQHGES
jgi:hypothetical protein